MKPSRSIGWFFQLFGGGGGDFEYAIAPVVQPTVDVSTDWPRNFQVFVGDFTSAVGTNLVNLPNSQVNPTAYDTGRGRRWFFLNIGSSVYGPGEYMVLFYEQNQQATRRVELVRYIFGDDALVPGVGMPFIGGTLYQGPSNIAVDKVFDLPFRGIDPVLVSDPDRLIFSFVTAGAGKIVTVRGLFIEKSAFAPIAS